MKECPRLLFSIKEKHATCCADQQLQGWFVRNQQSFWWTTMEGRTRWRKIGTAAFSDAGSLSDSLRSGSLGLLALWKNGRLNASVRRGLALGRELLAENAPFLSSTMRTVHSFWKRFKA
jgi:hypothetical protein